MPCPPMWVWRCQWPPFSTWRRMTWCPLDPCSDASNSLSYALITHRSGTDGTEHLLFSAVSCVLSEVPPLSGCPSSPLSSILVCPSLTPPDFYSNAVLVACPMRVPAKSELEPTNSDCQILI
ncbi:hypothetical protein DSO57_1020299 [Entomophthora muscae]|uniref:Uncharacterized protein n=1 Tax=Entomophthora muscae TaxID=34485 RepID=A0ACC2RUY0_9FUNG|nr:hypothetical protein DSO57_1020299 [Entomophthora muscae]